MGIEIERPELPEGEGQRDVLAEAAVYAQRNDVGPQLENAFATSRAKDVTTLIECMDRKRRYGPALEAIEADEIGALLGQPQTSAEQAFLTLDRAITKRSLDDEPLIKYLARKSICIRSAAGRSSTERAACDSPGRPGLWCVLAGGAERRPG